MKMYKPIDGLLVSRRRKGAPWSWVIALSVVVVLLLVYIALSPLLSDEPDPTVAPVGPSRLGNELIIRSLERVTKHLHNPTGSEVPLDLSVPPTSPQPVSPGSTPVVQEPSEAVEPVAGLAQNNDGDASPRETVGDSAGAGTVVPAVAPASDQDAQPAEKPTPVVTYKDQQGADDAQRDDGERVEGDADSGSGASEQASARRLNPPKPEVEKPDADKPAATKPVATKPVATKPPPKPAAKPKPLPEGTYVAGKAGDHDGKLKKGQTLYDALVELRLSAAQVLPAINSLKTVVDFRRSRPGDRFGVKYDKEGRILELRYRVRPELIRLTRYDAAKRSYVTGQEDVPMEVKVEAVGGTVSSSLYMALRDLGYGHAVVNKFIDIFNFDINFGSETKPGDTFRVVMEKLYIDGKFIRDGRILAVEYKGKLKQLRAYQYGEGGGGYYDGKGRSLRRMFLKNPVKNARITSPFGKRFHPILKRWKPHNGVDYAAPTGTPVNAVAEGEVRFAGEKGANGNLIILQHPNGMMSLYAHLSRFKRGLKRGQKVKQGDLIGYVGSTGRSTGPHLHLAIKNEKGAFVDPLAIKSTRGATLRGRDLYRFRRQMREMDRHLNKVKVKGPTGPVAAPPKDEPGGMD